MSHGLCGKEMILIAHRGNVTGPNPEMENNPLYIDRALEKGYDVEVDIRGSFYTKFYLGHDQQQYMISPEWLFERAGKLWLHAKDIQALHSLTQQASNFNVFWHQDDFYTITTKGFIWTYPGHTLTPESICVMPERFDGLYTEQQLSNCAGICTDFVEKYK